MTDSYTFNTPIGFLTIREEEKKLTKLFWEANSVQTMKNELHSDFLYEVYTQVNEYLTGREKQFDVPLKYPGTRIGHRVSGRSCRRYRMERREAIRRLRL